MIREVIYTLAAVFAVVTTFFFMIPVWNGFYTALVPVATTQITDPTFSSTLSTLPGNLNIIIQYSFVAVLIGLGIYLGLLPFREENTSNYG